MRLNQWQFIGNLGGDPEVRFSQAGKEIISFSVAVDDSRKLPDGEWENNTIWARVTCIGDRYGWLKDALFKGNPVWCQGKMSVRTYDRKDGGTGVSVEVLANDVQILLKKDQQGPSQGGGDSRDHWGTGATKAPPRQPAAAAAGGGTTSGRRQELADGPDDLEDLPF